VLIARGRRVILPSTSTHLSLGASKPATHGRFKTSRGVNVQ
jgi:hypothetical protein